MADEVFKRKLAAILSADAEGYSILMDQDEESTIRNLKAFRTAMSDLVQQYRGRVVDSPGDNILAEFTSVVDAVNCAVEVQRDFAERNAELSEDRRMQFRIGINLGDVVDDAGRIYGDGVNIAARVESMTEAGGICITGRAYDQVANKLGLEYEYLGEHQVKNISTPIRVYRVLSYPGAAAYRVVMAKHETEKAIEHIQKAMRLDPYFPNLYLVWLGQSLHSAGRYQEALDCYGEYSKRKNQVGEPIPRWVYYCFIITHLELGQIEKAYAYFEKASAMGGHYRYVGWAIQFMGYKNTDRERILKLFEPLHKIAAEIEIEKKKKVN